MDTTSIKRRAFALPKMPNEFLYVTRWHLFSIALVTTLLTFIVIASLKMHEVPYIATTTETEQIGIPKPRPARTIQQSARRPDPTPSTTKPTPLPVVTTPAATYSPPPSVTPCQKANVIHPQGATLSNAGLNQRIEAPRYYQVYGNTVEQLRSQLASCGPNGHFGVTNYRMNWAFARQPLGDGRCGISNPRVGIHVIVQYPSWQRSSQASATTITRWNTMMHGLKAHEQGHVNRSVQTARELLVALQTLPPVSCDKFQSAANAATNKYTHKLHSVNTQYDHATGHGRTEGAVL